MIDLEISNLTDAIENQLDRSKWKTYKFSDLVENIVEKVVPKNSGLKHYIGLEHLDSSSLKIARFGETESLIGDKLKIYKGDLIFAKRNSYLKRVAIAHFDGVASAHSMVLRPKAKNVDPNFLPFFMMSEVFWKRAIEISVGSLSPTINWKSLAKQEFLLPPKDQQPRWAELLWAMDEVIEKEKVALEKLERLKKAIQRGYFESPNVAYVEIDKVAKVYSGGTPDRKKMEYWNGTIPWIKTGEVNYQIITEVEEHITELGLKNSSAKLIPKGSILVAMYGQGITRGRVAITGIAAACNQASAVIQPNDGFLSSFIYTYLEYKYDDLRSLAHGANQQNLNLRMIKEFKIPNFDIDIQNKLMLHFQQIGTNKEKLNNKITASKALQKALVNQIF